MIHPTLWQLHQVLLGDRGAESIIVVDEGADELMQTALEDFVDPAVHQPRAHGAGLALCRSLLAVWAVVTPVAAARAFRWE